MKPEEFDRLIAGVNTIDKLANTMLKARVDAVKYGAKFARQNEESNLIGGGSVIDISTDMEQDTIRCPAKQDKIITRGQCLDFSGEQQNAEVCDGCGNFSTTRRKLIGPA